MVLGNVIAGATGGATVSIIIKAIDQFSGTFTKAEKATAALGGAITAIGVAGAFAIGGLIKMAGQFEQTQIAFTTMLGSAEEANKLLEELADFAARTPFTITGVEQNAKQLLAMSIEVDKLLPTLKALGDVSAGLNVPLARIAVNFGQVKVQGKLTGRELRDFAIAGVPLIAELAKNLNVSEAEIKEMVSAGKIGFPEVEAAFISMTSEGGKFFDLMDAQSKTFLGQVSNIQDSMIRVARSMGKIFLPAAKEVAGILSEIIGWFERHPTVATFAGVLLGVATALALIVGPLLIIVALLPALIAGFATLGIVTLPMTGTILLIGAAFFALIVAITGLFLIWDKLGTKTKILLAFLAPMITIPVLIIKNWGILKIFFASVWNVIVAIFTIGVNAVIGSLNLLITAFNSISRKIGGPIFDPLESASFDGALFNLKEMQKGLNQVGKSTEEVVKQKDAFDKLTEAQQRLVSGGFRFVPKESFKSGEEIKAARARGLKDADIFDPAGAFARSDFASRFAFEQASKRERGGILITIENVIGLDAEEISRTLSDELNNKISS